MTPDPRHAAWSDVHDLLPEGWVTGPTSYDPGAHRWSLTARAPNTGVRGKPSADITGQGEDELAALTDLVLRRPEYGTPDHMADRERAPATLMSPEPTRTCGTRSAAG